MVLHTEALLPVASCISLEVTTNDGKSGFVQDNKCRTFQPEEVTQSEGLFTPIQVPLKPHKYIHVVSPYVHRKAGEFV